MSAYDRATRQVVNRQPGLPDFRIAQHGHTSPRDGGALSFPCRDEAQRAGALDGARMTASYTAGWYGGNISFSAVEYDASAYATSWSFTVPRTGVYLVLLYAWVGGAAGVYGYGGIEVAASCTTIQLARGVLLVDAGGSGYTSAHFEGGLSAGVSVAFPVALSAASTLLTAWASIEYRGPLISGGRTAA